MKDSLSKANLRLNKAMSVIAAKDELIDHLHYELQFKEEQFKQTILGYKEETSHLYEVNRSYWNTIQKTKQIRGDVAKYKLSTIVLGAAAFSSVFVIAYVASN